MIYHSNGFNYILNLNASVNTSNCHVTRDPRHAFYVYIVLSSMSTVFVVEKSENAPHARIPGDFSWDPGSLKIFAFNCFYEALLALRMSLDVQCLPVTRRHLRLRLMVCFTNMIFCSISWCSFRVVRHANEKYILKESWHISTKGLGSWSCSFELVRCSLITSAFHDSVIMFLIEMLRYFSVFTDAYFG